MKQRAALQHSEAAVNLRLHLSLCACSHLYSFVICLFVFFFIFQLTTFHFFVPYFLLIKKHFTMYVNPHVAMVFLRTLQLGGGKLPPVVSQVLCYLDTKFQLLYACFRG